MLLISQQRFLRDRLPLDSLSDKTSPKAIKIAVSLCQKDQMGFDNAYSQVARIKNGKPGFRELAERVLYWIAFAQRQLTVCRLQHRSCDRAR